MGGNALQNSKFAQYSLCSCIETYLHKVANTASILNSAETSSGVWIAYDSL